MCLGACPSAARDRSGPIRNRGNRRCRRLASTPRRRLRLGVRGNRQQHQGDARLGSASATAARHGSAHGQATAVPPASPAGTVQRQTRRSVPPYRRWRSSPAPNPPRTLPHEPGAIAAWRHCRERAVSEGSSSPHGFAQRVPDRVSSTRRVSPTEVFSVSLRKCAWLICFRAMITRRTIE